MEIVLIGVVAIVVVIGLWAVLTYNGLIRLRNTVQTSWHQIEVQLQRRYDLIPNLVATVQGYARHEQAVFTEVTRARAAAVQSAAGSPAMRQGAESMLTAALGRLMAVAEAYPDLKANQNFLHLQAELTNTEDRIAAARRLYNNNVRDYNTRQQSIPTNIIAGMGPFNLADFFEVDNPGVRQAPKVSFDPPAGPGAAGGYPQQPPTAPPGTGSTPAYPPPPSSGGTGGYPPRQPPPNGPVT